MYKNILLLFVLFSLIISCNQRTKFNSNSLKKEYTLVVPYPDLKYGEIPKTAIEIDQRFLSFSSGIMRVEFYNDMQGAIIIKDSTEIFLNFLSKRIKGKNTFDFLVENDSILLIKFNETEVFQNVGTIKADKFYKEIKINLNNGLDIKLIDLNIN